MNILSKDLLMTSSGKENNTKNEVSSEEKKQSKTNENF